MQPHESLWPSSGDSGRGITSGTFYGNLRRYLKAAGLPPSRVHIFRHSAAKLSNSSRLKFSLFTVLPFTKFELPVHNPQQFSYYTSRNALWRPFWYGFITAKYPI